MDFSSADVPISRETWAPQSPPPSGPRAQNNSAPPSGPSGSYSDRPAASASLPYGDEDASAQHDRPRDDRDDRGRDYRDDRDSRAPRDPYRGNDSGSSDRYQPSGAIGVVPRRPEAAPKAEPNNVLGVFGLSIRTRERDLEEEFARHGEVDKVVIVYDQRTDRSRGFGFITMKTVPDATRCVESLNGLNLHGRSIRVDYSATRKPHQPTPGQYMGEKKPIYEDRYAPRGGDFRGSRGYDDRYNDSRRSGGGDRGGRYDERDRYRDERHRREHEDPYTSRPRRDDDLDRRSPPRRSRYSASPDRRSAPRRDYDAAPPAPAATTESARY